MPSTTRFIAVQRSAYTISNAGTWVILSLIPGTVASVLPISSNGRALLVIPILVGGAIYGAFRGWTARIVLDDESVTIVNGVRRWRISAAEEVVIGRHRRWKGDPIGGIEILRQGHAPIRSVVDYEPWLADTLARRTWDD